jgi:hypothetical protein
VESERGESPVADLKRTMARMFRELKEDKNNSMNTKRT